MLQRTDTTSQTSHGMLREITQVRQFAYPKMPQLKRKYVLPFGGESRVITINYEQHETDKTHRAQFCLRRYMTDRYSKLKIASAW